MKLIYASINLAEIGLLQGLLAENGIACAVRNQFLSSISLANAFLPELWIEDDDDWDKAREILNDWHAKGDSEFEDWICAGCGENNEGQFGACWKCGGALEE